MKELLKQALASYEKLEKRWVKAESRRLRKTLTEIKKAVTDEKRRLLETDSQN